MSAAAVAATQRSSRPAPAPVSIVNNGHTVQVDYPAGSSITLDSVAYQLAQYHFHAPAEHTIAGVSYPAELHMVHKSDQDELAVVSHRVRDEGEDLYEAWQNAVNGKHAAV